MLKRLDISNYALIENVNLSLNQGFTAMTGETGAGKSILLKALNLLLGERADTAALKQSEKKCILEAEFDITALNLKAFFKTHELDYDTNCIVRREFNSAGKSRAFINDTPVQLAQLKALGEQLISIHTQHQTLLILNADFQLDVLDHFASSASAVSAYKKEYRTYRKKVNELIELQVKDKENRKEKDYLTFLLNELEAANIEKLDWENLKLKAGKIENSEKIQTAIRFAKSIFENDSFSPSIGIKTLIETFDELKSYDTSYADISARLWSLKIELDDLEGEVTNSDTDEFFTDEEIAVIREQIEAVNALLFKHNLTEIEQLIALQGSLQNDLDTISTVENQLDKLNLEIETLKKALHADAVKIQKARLAAKPLLEKAVKQKLINLAMQNAELEVALSPLDKFGPTGLDAIDYRFKTNLGGTFSSLKKAASGGELSRLMLSILAVISKKKKLPTLIFDEIDTGVSGEVAAKIAQEFTHIGKEIQVIAITHLPQVAAKGSSHLHVAKEVSDNKTKTYVRTIDGDERVTILAQMISGEEVTNAAKENALQLLANK